MRVEKKGSYRQNEQSQHWAWDMQQGMEDKIVKKKLDEWSKPTFNDLFPNEFNKKSAINIRPPAK